MTKLLGFARFRKHFGRDMRKTERQAMSLTKSIVNRRRYSRFIRILGPGIITGAADDDPSGIATYSQAGAGHGLGLLWAFPLMLPLLMAVQESCARIGAITGKGLAAVIKENYSRKLLYMSVILVVVANTINIGADLGAMAATTQLFVNIPFVVLSIFYAVVIILLVIFVNYRTYAKILKWLAITLLAYPLTTLLTHQDWGQVFAHTFTTIPSMDLNTIYLFVGILGTTISPYLFFWDTSEQVEEEISKHNMKQVRSIPDVTKRYLHKLRIDNFVGMGLANVTAWFIVIACAATLNHSGITQITTAADAARALEPLVNSFPNAGLIAKLIFSVGIIGLGLLAVPVLAGSSSYAITEAIGWREGLYRKFKRAIGFYIVIIAATVIGLIINFLNIDPIAALIFTAVFNGIASIPLLFMLVKIGNNRNIMGDYRNGYWSKIGIWLALIVMTASVLTLFYSLFINHL